jgi:hypothetical protein
VQKETVGLNQGVRWVGDKPAEDSRPTIASQGIDKNLAHQARTLGSLSDEKFEEVVAEARDAVNRVVKSVVQQDDKAERRAERERDLAAKQDARRSRAGPSRMAAR